MSNESEEKPFLLVAAIDFGTTYSGYGFSFKTSKDEIRMPTNWGASMGQQCHKTPTSVLVNDKGEFVAFGYEAQSKYSDAIGKGEDDEEDEEDRKEDSDDVNELHFFKHFKMDLHGKTKLDRRVKVKATDGFELPAVNVFAMALQYLRDHLVKTVNNQQVTKLDPGQIRWVLTVPAIWSEVAKSFMKEAAVQGGLADATTSTNLIIALEPESASLYCRTMDIGMFVDGGSVQRQKQGKGDRYMVVDAGGGTMDITVHEVLDNDKVKELDRASGGPWGGIYVDKQIEALYDEVFGQEVMKKFRAKYPNHWINMMLDWERKKRDAKPGDTKALNLAIGAIFADFVENETGSKIGALVKEKKGCGMTFSPQGFLRITRDKINDTFSKVLDPTMDHLRTLIANKNISNLKCIFVVGGFGDSKYLQNRIKEEFESDTCSVLAPSDASLCVIKGAILFGHSPNAISSRIARCTIAFRSTMKVEVAKSKGLKYNQSQLSSDKKSIRYLRAAVKSGDEITEDSVVKSEICRPTNASTTSVKFPFYTVDRDDVIDPESEEAHHLGDVVVDVKPNKDRDFNQIQLVLSFGGTSIQVKAVHLKSKKTTKADFTRPEA